jgi:hypothetical protein
MLIVCVPRNSSHIILSHPVLSSKLNAHSMCAQEQDFTPTIQNVNTENQCLYYITFITQNIVFTRRLG